MIYLGLEDNADHAAPEKFVTTFLNHFCEKHGVRKIEPMYKLKKRSINFDDLVPLFLLTPIITVLLVVSLWFVLGAGGRG